VWWALPTRLRAAGIPIDDVTALSALLTLPWAVKFLWAPGVDALRSSGVPLRRSIFVAQLAMATTLVPLVFVELPQGFAWLVGALLVHAVCAATQDVAIDALAVASLPGSERGTATGWMQVGMLLGRAVFGGAALQVQAWVGAEAVIVGLIALLLASSTLVALARGEPAPTAPAGPGAFARSWAVLREVARRRATWLGVVFATLGGGGMEAAGSVAGPLLVDRGFSEAAVGRFFAVPAVVAMALGSLVGGRLSDRGRRRTAAAIQLVVMTLVLLALAVTSAGGAPPGLLVTALTGAYAMFGAFTAASYALYMDLTDPDLGGTQFSSFMAAVNLAAVWGGWAVGRLAASFDYPAALATLAIASLGALALLPAMRRP
jgi:predicted MFS family arabinose efflux permease